MFLDQGKREQNEVKRKMVVIQLRKGGRVSAEKLFSFSCQYKQLSAFSTILCLLQKDKTHFYIKALLLAAVVVISKAGGRGSGKNKIFMILFPQMCWATVVRKGNALLNQVVTGSLC